MKKYYWKKINHVFYGDVQPDEFLHIKETDNGSLLFLGELSQPGVAELSTSEARRMLGNEFQNYTPVETSN